MITARKTINRSTTVLFILSNTLGALGPMLTTPREKEIHLLVYLSFFFFLAYRRFIHISVWLSLFLSMRFNLSWYFSLITHRQTMTRYVYWKTHHAVFIYVLSIGDTINYITIDIKLSCLFLIIKPKCTSRNVYFINVIHNFSKIIILTIFNSQLNLFCIVICWMFYNTNWEPNSVAPPLFLTRTER